MVEDEVWVKKKKKKKKKKVSYYTKSFTPERKRKGKDEEA